LKDKHEQINLSFTNKMDLGKVLSVNGISILPTLKIAGIAPYLSNPRIVQITKNILTCKV